MSVRGRETLRNDENPPSDREVREAALQFVRKISGYRAPSKANTAVFEAAVDEVAEASWRLLVSLNRRTPVAAG